MGVCDARRLQRAKRSPAERSASVWKRERRSFGSSDLISNNCGKEACGSSAQSTWTSPSPGVGGRIF